VDIGNGIGFGRFPSREGIWEGGHSRRHPRSQGKFCGCGGKAISKNLDAAPSVWRSWISKPKEFFEMRALADARCKEFVTSVTDALAAATATSIHMEGREPFSSADPK